MLADRDLLVDKLKARIAELESKRSSEIPEVSIAGLPTLLLRVNEHGLIRYYNSAFAQYLEVERNALVGQPLSVLARFFEGDVVEAIESSGSTGRVVTDGRRAKVLEVHSTYKGGWLDVSMQDVTSAEQFRAYVQRYAPAGFEELSDDEKATFRFPERRYMTVSFVDLRGFTNLSEQLSPEEVRDTVNAYLEEAIDAVHQNGAMVDKIVGDEVMALFGAPRYHADHALRAIKTAFDTMAAIKALQAQFVAMGKQMPSCGIGINTGEMVLGNIGPATKQNYTVMGSAVNLASRICSVANSGEVLVTEETLRAVIESLPEDWQVVRAVSDTQVDLSVVRGKIDGVSDLDEETRGLVYAVGPGVEQNIQQAQFYFYYLYQVKPRGSQDPVRVISVVPGHEAGRIQLSGDTIAVSKTEKIFGRFRLVEIIGRGGMGEVWKARDNFGNNVAIKMLRAGEGASESQLRRFKREAEVMARLSHRNICRIFEVGEAEGVSFIAMEYVDGATLAEILGHRKLLGGAADSLRLQDVASVIKAIQKYRNEPVPHSPEEEQKGPIYLDSAPDGYLVLPVQQVIAILTKVCEAIQAAHEIGVLHRDLKPGNVILRPDGDPVVMDFGLAKMGDSHDDLEMSLSMSGQIVGTIEYMAPEQAVSSKDVDERADVYALGAILYQMLTGSKHFQSTGNILGDAQRLQSYEAPPPRTIRKALDPDLEVITQKALRTQSAERYRSATALKDDLERYRRGEVISARGITIGEVISKWIKRNRSIALVIGGSGILLLASAIFFVLQLEVSRREAIEQKQEAEKQSAEARSANDALLVKTEEAKAAQKNAEDALAAVKEAEAAKAKAQEDALNANKRSEPYYRMLQAQQYFAQGQFDQALPQIEQSLKLKPQFVDAWMLKARLHLGLFEVMESKAALEAAAKCAGFTETAEYVLLNDVVTRYSKVIPLLPAPGQDRELQLALAKVLRNSTVEDDQRAGRYLQTHSPGQ